MANASASGAPNIRAIGRSGKRPDGSLRWRYKIPVRLNLLISRKMHASPCKIPSRGRYKISASSKSLCLWDLCRNWSIRRYKRTSRHTCIV